MNLLLQEAICRHWWLPCLDHPPTWQFWPRLQRIRARLKPSQAHGVAVSSREAQRRLSHDESEQQIRPWQCRRRQRGILCSNCHGRGSLGCSVRLALLKRLIVSRKSVSPGHPNSRIQPSMPALPASYP
eukprot:s549_g11.t1